MKKILLILCIAALFAWGCAEKQVQTVPEQQTQKETAPQPVEEKAPVKAEQPKEEAKTVDPYTKLPVEHRVTKGECLWWISEFKEVYNDPFMWPLIFKANRDKIKNPDRIYPNQVFSIPRAFTLEELQAGRKKAGAGKPFNPPKEANLPQDIKAALGWGK